MRRILHLFTAWTKNQWKRDMLGSAISDRENYPGPSLTHIQACRHPTGQVRVPARRLGVHCPVVPRPAAAIGPAQGCNTSLPSENDPARHSPKLAAPIRTKLGRQPADSESNARLYRHVRAVTTDSPTKAKRTATHTYVRRRSS